MLRGVACEAFERGKGGATDMAVVSHGVGVGWGLLDMVSSSDIYDFR